MNTGSQPKVNANICTGDVGSLHFEQEIYSLLIASYVGNQPVEVCGKSERKLDSLNGVETESRRSLIQPFCKA